MSQDRNWWWVEVQSERGDEVFARQGPYGARGRAEREASVLRTSGLRVRVQARESASWLRRGAVGGAVVLGLLAHSPAELLPI